MEIQFQNNITSFASQNTVPEKNAISGIKKY